MKEKIRPKSYLPLLAQPVVLLRKRNVGGEENIQSFTNHARASSRLLKAGNSRREKFSTNSEGICLAATEADFLT
jgi:hypothetical protein